MNQPILKSSIIDQQMLPTRTQQLGLIILLAVLVLYVIARVGW